MNATGGHIYHRGKSPQLAGTDEKVRFRARKTPSRKRSPAGRFVQYHCEKCEDSGTMGCPTCDGSGIGMHGDPDTSRCLVCKGHGTVDCDGEAHLTDDQWRQTHFVLSGWGRGGD